MVNPALNIVAFVATVLIAVVALIGVQHVYQEDKQEANQCLMSWMNPNYIPIKLNPAHPTLSKYNLYLYREGSVQQATEQGYQLRGIPVLFVHGNAGSYKQVRSLGVATVTDPTKTPIYDSHIRSIIHKAQKAKYTTEIDVFAVDFQEELSALHGQLLYDQADFVNYCIKTILSMYKRNPHDNVITVGHSIGGMVLRAAPLLESYQSKSINTIITLSTPHVDHPLLFDRSLNEFYTRVNNVWKEQVSDPDSELSNMLLVSISGGFRDTLIRSDTTSIDSLIPATNGFSVSAYSIPNVRASADHLSVTWCKQLVQTVGLTLLDMVNDKANPKLRFDLPLQRRLEIAQNNFLSSPTYHRLVINDPLKYSIAKREQILSGKQPVTITASSYQFGPTNRPSAHVYEWNMSKQYDSISILTNLNQLEYHLFGVKNKQFNDVDDLSGEIETLPFIRKTDKHLQEEDIQSELPHTLVYTNCSQYESILIVFTHDALSWHDVRMTLHSFDSRSITVTKTVDAPLWRQLLSKNIFTFSRSNTSVHKIHVPLLGRQLNYKIKVKQDSKVLLPAAYYYYAQERDSLGHVTFEDRFVEDASEFVVKFFNSGNEKNDFNIFIFSDPNTNVQISISHDVKGILSNVIRFNASSIVACVFAILFFTIGYQASTNFETSVGQALIHVFYTRVLPVSVALATLFFIESKVLSTLVFDRHPTILALESSLVQVEQMITHQVHSLFNTISSITPIVDHEATSHTYAVKTLHQTDVIYISLAFLFAFALLHSIIRVLLFITKVLNATIMKVAKSVFGMLPKNATVTTLVWVVIVNALCILAMSRLHSGVCLLLSIIIMLVALSYPTKASNSTVNVRMTILVISFVAFVMMGASIVLYMKEWLLQLELNSSKRGSIVDTVKHVVGFLPRPPFADTYTILVIPFFWCLLAFSGSFVFKTRLVGIVFEIVGMITLALCRFSPYRVLYLTSVVAVVLFLSLITNMAEKTTEKKKKE